MRILHTLSNKLRLLLTVIGAVAIGVVATLLLISGKSSRSVALQSYFFDASLDIKPLQGAPVPVDGAASRLRAWFQSPALFRREYSFKDATLGDYSTVQASDGYSVLLYDGRANTYGSVPLPEIRFAASIPGGLLIGPLPTASLDDFLATFPQGDGKFAVRKAGRDTVAGRRTDVVEITPPQGALMKIWVDRSHEFVLRYEVHDAMQDVTAVVNKVEYNQTVSRSDLQFTPPANARQIEIPVGSVSGSQGSANVLGSPDVVAPPGFMMPSYVPEGWTVMSSSIESAGGNQVSIFRVRVQPAEKRGNPTTFVDIVQQYRAGGLNATPPSGTAVAVGSLTGYAMGNASEQRLIFAVGDIIVTLSTDVLSPDELQRIAESMH